MAIELTETNRSRLARLQGSLERKCRGVRWVQEHQLHMTVKFLGDVPDGQVPDVSAALDLAGSSGKPFTMDLQGAGCFPPRGRDVRVVWAGLREPSGELERAHQWLELALEPLGFPPERRPFSPHVTLGRAKAPRRAAGIRERLARLADFDAGVQRIDEIVFFESRLRKTGPEHTVLVRERLGSRDGPRSPEDTSRRRNDAKGASK